MTEIIRLLAGCHGPLTTVAPPVAVQLRMKGFHEQVLRSPVPLCEADISV